MDAGGAGFCGSRLNFDGGNSAAEAYPESTVSYINEYVGSDPSHWRTQVPAVTRVRYKNVYPGIDVVYYSRHGKLEYDFVIAPGADPRRIRLSFDQVDSVALNAGGNATIGTNHATAALAPPVVYQERDGRRRAVTAHYVQRGPRTLGIAVGRYDRGQPLVVDPVLYATYLGGSGADSFHGLKLDSSGNMVVVGSTNSADFPRATGAANGADALVVKLNAAGTAILYATYIGGSGTDSGTKVSVDPTGAVYVMGGTGSADFPYTAGAYRANPADAQGTFIAKLNATGGLVYSAQVQGTFGYPAPSGSITSMVADSTGRAIYAGSTEDTALPVTVGVFQATKGGAFDGFIGALNATGSGLSFLTYLGGTYSDSITALAIDSSGAIVAVGDSTYRAGYQDPGCASARNSFPVTSGAYRGTYSCNLSDTESGLGYYYTVYTDSFVAKLNAEGTALIVSTFAPAVGTYGLQAVALDGANNIYLAGETSARTLYGEVSREHFVAKMNPTASSLLYLTTVGSVESRRYFNTSSTGVKSMVPDGSGGVFVAGSTADSYFPVTCSIGCDTPANPLPYLIHFDAQGQAVFSSRLTQAQSIGRSYPPYTTDLLPVQSIGGITLDASSTVIVAGTATAGQVTSTPGALQASASGGTDGFVERFTPDCGPTAFPTQLSLPSSDLGNSVLGSITVNNGTGCLIALTSSAVWLTFDSSFSTTTVFGGSGSQPLYLRANDGPARTATLTVGTQTVTVTQAAFSCSYSVAPTSVTILPTGGSGRVQVTAPSKCAWNPASSAGWLSITAGSPGTGIGTLSYTVAANPTGQKRSAIFTIGDQTVSVTQLGYDPTQIPSLVSLSPFQGSGDFATLTLVYGHTSGWVAIQSAEFILNPRWEPRTRGNGCYIKYSTVTSLFTLIADDGVSVAGTTPPGGPFPLSNSQCALMSSSVTGSGTTLTLVVSLSFSPAFSGQRHIWMQAVDYQNISTNWLVYGAWSPGFLGTASVPWYRIFDPFSESYLYSSDPNEYSTLGARGFVQQGTSGLVMNRPATVGGIDNIGWYRVFVNATSSHFWTSDRNEFLTLVNQQQAYVGEGVAAFVMPYINAQGQVSPQATNTIPFYRAASSGANLHFWTSDPDEFFGTNGKHLPAGYFGEGIACYILPAAGAQFGDPATGTAEADDGSPAVVAVVNGASYSASGVIASGQALSVYGRHLGGRVLLNGLPAQVVSAKDNEIRVVVPKELAEGSEVSLEVAHRGRRTKAVKLTVVRANPAIFGSNQYGRGNAQARNADGTMNGPEHAAVRGSVVTLYTTGGVALDLPVEVHIGGQPAEVIGMRESAARAGVIEVRIRVPDAVAPAPFQPVVLHVGNLFSQPGVGLAIQ